jgi:outer membrane lipoprotein-sorting protein/uncharacterized protein YneF (UPF0154 family)
MRKKEWVFTITIGIIIGIVGGIFIVPRLIRSTSGTTAAVTDDVLRATLTSHQKWDTLQGAADIIWYGPDGETQSYTSTFAIQQPNLAKISVESMDAKGSGGYWISDGENAYDVDPARETHTMTRLPTFSTDLSMLPATLEEAQNADAIYRHPFGMLIPSPIGDYLYPQWFSQGGGTYTLVGEDIFLDRKVWIVEHQKNANMVNAWIDQETGVILKYTQKMGENLYVEVTFTSFRVNAAIDNDLFSLPPE